MNLAARFRFLPVLAALSLAACTDPRANSISRLHRADAAALRIEVFKLYKQFFGDPSNVLIPVRPEVWPPAILKLRPLRLNLYADGLAITLQASPGYEYGLHIQPASTMPAPRPTERTQFENLEPGIFFFTQKR